MRLAAVSWMLSAALWAQDPPPPAAETPQAGPSKPVYQNTGKPIVIQSKCRPEDLSAQGLGCSSDEPCAVFLELSDVEAVGGRLVLSGNLHTASATLESILLSSEDGGKTWTEPADRIPLAGIENIQFIDFEYGWAGGQLLYSLPRDPFLLLTTDGGKSWEKQTVYGETRPGAVDQFWFDSRTSGTLLIDRGQTGEDGMRHELYETQTGGRNWSLRQVDRKPIAVKRPKPATGDLRVRPDAATKSYRVERRQGERWSPVASFLIAAGECKSPEPQAAEPPPPPEEPAPAPERTPAPSPRKPPTLKR